MKKMFLNEQHRDRYRELLNEFGSSADHGYQALSFVLGAPGMGQAVRVYKAWRDGDSDQDELWKDAAVLSHGQQLLLRVAMNLFSGRGHVNLADLCGVLDRSNFLVFQRAVLIYRHGEARLSA